MKGTIITNAFRVSANDSHKIARMQEEFALLNVQTEVVANNKFLCLINDRGDISTSANADFVVYFDKDKYIARMLKKNGARVFNNCDAIELSDDKMATHIHLANSGILMPKTLAGALCYPDGTKISSNYLDQIEQQLGFPLVAKLCFGSYGEQVQKICNRGQLAQFVEQHKTSAYLFQKYEECDGQDIRVIVVGGRAVAAMKRTAKAGDFRSNIEQGGIGQRFDLTDEVKDIAQNAAKLLDLDFCGVDILLSNNGLKLCEVNCNAMFKAIEAVSAVNIARLFAQHIVSTIEEEKGKK